MVLLVIGVLFDDTQPAQTAIAKKVTSAMATNTPSPTNTLTPTETPTKELTWTPEPIEESLELSIATELPTATLSGSYIREYLNALSRVQDVVDDLYQLQKKNLSNWVNTGDTRYIDAVAETASLIFDVYLYMDEMPVPDKFLESHKRVVDALKTCAANQVVLADGMANGDTEVILHAIEINDACQVIIELYIKENNN